MQDLAMLIYVCMGLLVVAIILLIVVLMKSRQALDMSPLEAHQEMMVEGIVTAVREARRETQEQAALTAQGLRKDIYQVNEYLRDQHDRQVQSMNAFKETTDQRFQTLSQNLGVSLVNLQDKTLTQLTQIQKSQFEASVELGKRLSDELVKMQTLVNTSLESIRSDNDKKLESMRSTVQEKLDATLTDRLNTSFKVVDEKLGLVQSGLGEMRAMAQSVRDLKGVLTNVKTRGNFGETQLESILSNILTPEQYQSQAKIFPGKNVQVDFAIRMPGQDSQTPCWLPIDAKFPVEDYQRVLEAEEQMDKDALAKARKALATAVKKQAESIREKYVQAPITTEFAIMVLPSEGLYAEVLRIPGLFDELQMKYRVTPAGPTVVSALINSLQMGFVTLSLQKRSAEVWHVLSEVKSEFENFTKGFEKVESEFDKARKSLEAMGTRQRALQRKMMSIQETNTDDKL